MVQSQVENTSYLKRASSMRMIFLTFSIFLFTLASKAEVNTYLKTDPVLMLIQGNDSDAMRLYDSMEVKVQKISDHIWQKKILSPTGQIEFVCKHDDLTQKDSCNISIKRAGNVSISEVTKSVYLVTYTQEDTKFLFENLKKNSDRLVPMYVTEKQDLAYTSSTQKFVLSYRSVAK